MNECFQVVPIRAFRDNYIWCIRRGNHAAVVDPGDAEPVFEYLADQRLELSAILATHHHLDHIGGIGALTQSHSVPVWAPVDDRIDCATNRIDEGDLVPLPELGVALRVLEIPGHTLTHVAYYGPNLLFCGDTLFACGCGRLFEGTPFQMVTSLAKLAALPDDTLVYCGHEYTQSNLRFGRVVDPLNPVLVDWEQETTELRNRQQPTLPSTIGREKRGNPFLRCDDPTIAAAARRHAGQELGGPVEVFAVLREWKNVF
jgi:hydroxyacylglutathione hydrolase